MITGNKPKVGFTVQTEEALKTSSGLDLFFFNDRCKRFVSVQLNDSYKDAFRVFQKQICNVLVIFGPKRTENRKNPGIASFGTFISCSFTVVTNESLLLRFSDVKSLFTVFA